MDRIWHGHDPTSIAYSTHSHDGVLTSMSLSTRLNAILTDYS